MAETYIGEIRLFGGNYAPHNWALCEGQLLNVNEHTDLYAVLGTTYGGDGVSTFALPDLRGRIAVGEGTGPGLTTRIQGQRFGVETVTLDAQSIPSHTHAFRASKDRAEVADPEGHVLAKMKDETTTFYEHIDDTPADEVKAFSPKSLANSGKGDPHSNLMPSLCVSHIIALRGTFPQRS